MKWYLHVLRNYANFNGRARRTEYWMFILFNIIFAVAANLVDMILFGKFSDGNTIGILSPIYSLAMFIPGLAVLIRRLHDAGKSGWFWLIVLIPIIGWIWLIVVLCSDSEPDNEYGPNPKGTEFDFEMQ
jgi:uncharacterized membrane protein YhaH (DUF805 family)